MLPLSIQNSIQSFLKEVDSKSSLKVAREELTKRYRTPQEREKRHLQIRGGFTSSAEVIAYLAARFPATFAAVETVLRHVLLEDITSVLDLGAGPGTAALAAALRWPLCTRFHLVEGDRFMGEVSQRLLKGIPELPPQSFSFQRANLVSLSLDTSFDLVILSYVLNELSSEDQEKVLQRSWEKTSKGLVIVVPGTPNGYRQLMKLRDLLIARGAFIAAPCPHQEICPLVEDDWCHFSTRLPRSSFHREIKGVSLSYEDEKFSYLVALRVPVSHSDARIIRKPLKRSGHITLDLCTQEGIQRQTVSKRDKLLYKSVINVAWGDSWDAV